MKNSNNSLSGKVQYYQRYDQPETHEQDSLYQQYSLQHQEALKQESNKEFQEIRTALEN